MATGTRVLPMCCSCRSRLIRLPVSFPIPFFPSAFVRSTSSSDGLVRLAGISTLLHRQATEDSGVLRFARRCFSVDNILFLSFIRAADSTFPMWIALYKQRHQNAINKYYYQE
jgi:hypothetical protein